MKKTTTIKKMTLQKSVARSSKIEGLSFRKARKNTTIINKLRKHGRAFSV